MASSALWTPGVPGPLVDYVLLAEFDNTEGAVMRHQHPSAVPLSSEHELAHFMLPDGLHKVPEDQTVFLLRSRQEQQREASGATAEAKGEEEEEEEEVSVLWEAPDGAPSGSLPTLVPHGKGAEGGVILDASLVLSRGLPPRMRLSVARGTEMDTQDIHLSLPPAIERLSATKWTLRSSLQDAAAYDMEFFGEDAEGVGQLVCQVALDRCQELLQGHSSASSSLLFGLSVAVNRTDVAVKRGASFRALAVCCKHPITFVFRRLLKKILNEELRTGERTPKQICELAYHLCNDLDLSGAPSYTPSEKLVISRCLDPSDGGERSAFSAFVEYAGEEVELRFPLCLTNAVPADGTVSLLRLVQKFESEIMTIFTAILTEHRVLFLGKDGVSAFEVCTMVLAAMEMVVPFYHEAVCTRLHPYVSLDTMSCLEVPGVVAGATNPIFEEQTMWWDVLCDVSSGKVTVNRKCQDLMGCIAQCKEFDSECFSQALAGVHSHLVRAQGSQSCELWLRSHFQDITHELLDLCTGHGEFGTPESRQKAYEVNKLRLQAIQKSRSFESYLRSCEAQEQVSGVCRRDLVSALERLRVRDDLSSAEMLDILGALQQNLGSEAQVSEVLALLPDAHGGLYRIAMGLYHSHAQVRRSSMEVLLKVRASKLGEVCVRKLNFFLDLGFRRAQAEFL